MKKLTSEWFQAALIRAIKTVAQTVVGMVTVGAAFSEVNWGYIWSVAAVAGILSLLTSIAGLPETTYDAEASIDEEGVLKIGNVSLKEDDPKVVRLKVKK